MTIKNYTTGFIACLALTAASFGLVQLHLNSGHFYLPHAVLFADTVLLALAQLLVQMLYFLHIGRQSKLRDLVALAFAVTVALLVVGGSLWIMSNLSQGQQMPFEGSVAPQNEQ